MKKIVFQREEDFNLKEAFVDLDENDLKFIDIELPPDLSKLIELDETGELKINKNVQSIRAAERHA